MSEKPEDKAGARKMTARRQAILAGAFAQLRKSRKAIEPGILQKIRDIVSGSPEIMKKLGVTDAPKDKIDEDMPLSSKTSQAPHKEEAKKPTKTAKAKSDYEVIDQEKNMDVVAKLMELSPDNKENIKSLLKNNQKS